MNAKLVREGGAYVLHVNTTGASVHTDAKIKVLDRNSKMVLDKTLSLLPVAGAPQGQQDYKASFSETEVPKKEQTMSVCLIDGTGVTTPWFEADLSEITATTEQDEKPWYKKPLTWLIVGGSILMLLGIFGGLRGCSSSNSTPQTLSGTDTNSTPMIDTSVPPPTLDNTNNAATPPPSPAQTPAVPTTAKGSIPAATTSPLGDSQNVINNSGVVEKLIINNHNYYGGDGRSGGTSTPSPEVRPWPWDTTPNKVEKLLDTSCVLPPGAKLEIVKQIPAGEDHSFTKPGGVVWNVLPSVSTGGVMGSVNIGTIENPNWVHWQRVPQTPETFVSEYRFKAPRDRAVTVTFLMTR